MTIMEDPWDWDIDRVIQELCSENRSWEPPNLPANFPPEQLKASLQEHDVVGSVLITYDQEILFSELGVKSLRHRFILKQAITQFRTRSQKYKLDQKRQHSESIEEYDVNQASEDVGQKKPTNGFSSHTLTTPAAEKEEASHSLLQLTHNTQLGTIDTPTLLPPDQSGSLHEPPSPEQQPSQKRRRVAPLLVSADIDTNVTRNIPTEADVIMASRPTGFDIPRDNGDIINSTRAYLGEDAFTRVDIFDDDQPSREAGKEKEMLMEPLTGGRIPPGRRLQIHQLYKRQLLLDRMPPKPHVPKSDMVWESNNPDHDEVLPLYGDSDEDGGYDSDTWAEIQAEKDEQSQLDNDFLSLDQMQKVIDDSIQQFVSDWKDRKMAKLTRKANQIWREARRNGLKWSIDKNRRIIETREARIAKYREGFVTQQWRNINELKANTLILQQTIEDKEYSSWVLSVITDDAEPKKHPHLVQTGTRKARIARPIASDGEEILTSESEEELDDFIVEDEPPPMLPDMTLEGSPMDIVEDGGASPIRQQSIPIDHPEETIVDPEDTNTIDLTQVEDAEKGDVKTSFKTPTKSQKHHVIDLVTPNKSASTPSGSPSTKRNHKPGKSKVDRQGSDKQENRSSALIMDIDDLDSLERMVAEELRKLYPIYLSFVASMAIGLRPKDIRHEGIRLEDTWLDMALHKLHGQEYPKPPLDTREKRDTFAVYTLLRLFEIYKDGNLVSVGRFKKLSYKEITVKCQNWGKNGDLSKADSYVDFLCRLFDRFEIEYEKSDPKSDLKPNSQTIEKSPSPKRGRRRKHNRNREAEDLRLADRARVKEQAHRRQVLRAKLLRLEATGSIDLENRMDMIINESKEDDKGFIYVHPEIAARIKEHQVAGVRFMWDQVVESGAKQGCLLAHTMGLGKTMQIITLLVAIAQAASSEDPAISSQIPDDLKESKTLMLCPPSLVDNWMDELLFWAPEDHKLGEFFKVDQTTPREERTGHITSWDDRGGILLFGYSLFKEFIDNQETREILCDGPNIVVADEAHIMKNPSSQIHMATANFRTQSRIALTGSPLANKVEEYHAMVNWVAPNYLSDIREFKAEYATPISEGLKPESTRSQYKRGLKMLKVLKEVVAPKVQRITITVLKQDIPVKQEFLLTVPLTDIQHEAYETFIRYQLEHPGSNLLSAMDTLGVICAHPAIFHAKLQGRESGSKISLPSELISMEKQLLTKIKDINDISLSWKIQILLSILEGCKRIGDAVLIFSQSILTLDYLEHTLRKRKFLLERLDGSTPTNIRQGKVKQFNNGEIEVFLISTRAGGLGLNMIGANRVIIFDVKFNPQHEQQAVGRAYRLGQKKPVYVYRLYTGGTVEEKMLNMAIFKTQLSSRVIDKKNPIPKAEQFGHKFELPRRLKDTDENAIKKHRGKDSVLDQVFDELKSGVNTITMMDTFEEEALEDYILTDEDNAEAAQLIAQEEARRLGKPLPPPLPSTSLNNAYNSLYKQTNGEVFGALKTGESSLGGATPQHDHVQPIPGATTHLGRSPPSPGNISAEDVKIWENQPAFKGELVRAFIGHDIPYLDEKGRRDCVQLITTAVWSEQRSPEQQGLLKSAIMMAASSKRFVEAICSELLTPTQLASMEPSDITAKRTDWDRMTEDDWAQRKNDNHQSTQSRVDPEVGNPVHPNNNIL
ncbi:uncharacterized protein F4822DRAFT_385338 [Hypoxylon trugodes]|uniref:uncharacterized protein n=1 Tax=Hypoxylon trugodes TaxID=326681 RepID=UPI0021A16CF4|nr:uncharacterized protein F4822DRAFT_385338 [Hypoxylon trugodes]KAI1393640.1 hypothetical protein F4822DRAFT_385338 [Hypoxylon trugodes]